MATFLGESVSVPKSTRKGVKVGSRISIHHFADSVRNLSGGRWHYRTALWRLEVPLTPQEIERIKSTGIKKKGLNSPESIQRDVEREQKPSPWQLCVELP